MPHLPLPVVAENVIDPRIWFEHADPQRWGGKVLRNSAGFDVIEIGDSVRLLPHDWRELAEQQGQQIQPHEPHQS